MFKNFPARAFVIVILVFNSFFVFAQQQIASIPLKGEVVGFAQCAFSGDTTFVAYMENIGATMFYRTRLVFKDGTYKVVRNSRLMDKAFIDIDNANDSLFIYFLEEKRKTISITYAVNNDSVNSSRVAHKLPKAELLLGSFKRPDQRGFNIVTASPTNKKITVLHVHGSMVTQERQIDLPIAFFEQKLMSFAFIPEGHIPSPIEAEARTKVYWNTDQVIITEDIRPNYMTKTPGKTTMVSIDLATGKHQNRLILEPTENEGSETNHFFLLPDGTQKPISAPLLHGKTILYAENYGDSILFYYGEGSKRSVVLKSLSWNRISNSIRALSWSHELNSRIWASYKKDGLHLLCGSKKSDTLELVHISRLNVTNKKIHVPIKLFERANQSTALIPDGAEVMPSQAAAKAKIYVSDTSLLISFFQRGRQTDTERVYATNTFVKVNMKTGATEQLSFKDSQNNYFGMFVHEDLIYKIVKHYKAFTVDVYRWNRTLVKSFTIDKKNHYIKQPAYLRDDRAKRVFDNRSVLDAIANGGDEFISVHKAGDGTLILKVGTDIEFTQGTPIITVFGPVLHVVTAVTSVAVMATSNSDLFADHYFYLKGNVNDGFTYTNQSGLLQQKIDDAELFNEKDPVDYKYKWYLRTAKSDYAFYVPRKGKARLSIVKFTL